MSAISFCPLLKPSLFSTQTTQSWNLKSRIQAALFPAQGKTPSNVEMCSYPVLTIPGCHPAALISAFSSAFWVPLPDLSAPCHSFLVRGLPLDSVFLTIIHKKKPHRILHQWKNVFTLTGKREREKENFSVLKRQLFVKCCRVVSSSAVLWCYFVRGVTRMWGSRYDLTK